MESNATPCFSILIPTWNNLGILKVCLDSLRKNSHYPHQIIVHVNAGTDGTLEYVKREGLDYTHTPENAGICVAMNQAAKLAWAGYLCFLNDDMYVCPEWDLPLVEEIKKRPSGLFYLSSTLIEPLVTRNRCVISPHDFGRTPETFREAELLSRAGGFIKEDWSGASWPPSVVSRKLWDAVGGYSEEFSPGMYSDPDFSMKLWNAGVRDFVGVGKSRVYHFMSMSVSRLGTTRNNGRARFLAKWGMASSTFYRHYLRLGRPYQGPLASPAFTPAYVLARLRDILKRIPLSVKTAFNYLSSCHENNRG